MPLLVEFENGSWSAYDADRWTGGNAIDKAHLWKGDEKVADVRTYTTIEKIDQEVYEALLDAFYGEPEFEVEVLPEDEAELADAIAAFVDAFSGSEEAADENDAEAIDELADIVADAATGRTVEAKLFRENDDSLTLELNIKGLEFMSNLDPDALAEAAADFTDEELEESLAEVTALMDSTCQTLAGIVALHFTSMTIQQFKADNTADDAA